MRRIVGALIFAVLGAVLCSAQSRLTMHAVTIRTDTFTAGGYAARAVVPTPWNGKFIIYHHGAGETDASLTSDAQKALALAQFTNAGYLVAASATASGQDWGNQATLDVYVALQAYLISHYGTPDKTAFWAQSMGGLSALLTVASGNITACAVLGTYPVTSLASVFASNAGSLSSLIRSAYGIAADGSDYASKTAGHDPLLITASAYANVPMLFYHSAGDTLVTKVGNSDAFAALVGGVTTITVTATSGDHGDNSNFPPAVAYLAFIQANC